MALHGEVKVNNAIIAGWEARRVLQPSDDEIHLYECEVVLFEDGAVKKRVTFHLEHVVEDGALCLASEVLARAYSTT